LGRHGSADDGREPGAVAWGGTPVPPLSDVASAKSEPRPRLTLPGREPTMGRRGCVAFGADIPALQRPPPRPRDAEPKRVGGASFPACARATLRGVDSPGRRDACGPSTAAPGGARQAARHRRHFRADSIPRLALRGREPTMGRRGCVASGADIPALHTAARALLLPTPPPPPRQELPLPAAHSPYGVEGDTPRMASRDATTQYLEEETTTRRRGRGRVGLTWRSVSLGLVLSGVLCALTPYNDYVLGNTYIAGNHFPMGAVFVLLCSPFSTCSSTGGAAGRCWTRARSR